MLLRTTLALWVFLFTFPGTDGLVQAKASKKDPKATTMSKAKWAAFEGFRSAKFGMKESEVMRAITKDFKVSKSKVKQSVNPLEQTINLEVTVPKLIEVGGTAKIGYLLGHKSKKLMQVNMVWGSGLGKKVDVKDIISTANLLRSHFTKKRHQKEGFAVNLKVNDAMTIVFRGKDKKGRMAILSLTNPKVKKGEDTKISLKLSYILDAKNPDILSLKEGDF